jgi:hypothetical protein
MLTEWMQNYTWYAAIVVAAIEGLVVCWSVWDVVAIRRRGASYKQLIALELANAR